MKTQIIQLSQNDDELSVRDKMAWSQARRILLVWPERGRVLHQQLDLTLISRHAEHVGAQLALVTHDPEVTFFARQFGIPTFDNPRTAQDAPWKHRPRRVGRSPVIFRQSDLVALKSTNHSKVPAWLDHPVTKLVCLVMSMLALFSLSIFILPSAKITLSPKVESQSMVFDLTADPAASAINYSAGSLPVYHQDAIIEGHAMIAATGSILIPDKIATGILRFTNKSKQTISIPGGTTVSTIGIDPIRFITAPLNDVNLEPNKSITLAARAIMPGPSGNLSANKLVVLEGVMGQYLTVTNPDAMNGGTEASVPSPSNQDMSDLRRHLLSKLLQDAMVEMQPVLPVDDILITPTITSVETLAETAFPSIGEPGGQLEISIRVKVRAQVVSGENLHNLILPVMDSYTPQGFLAIAQSLEITQMSSPTLGQDGKTHWAIQASRKLQAVVTQAQVAELISGRTMLQASDRLSSALPLAKNADIIMAPGWWPRLPFLTMRIEVLQTGVQ